jgi:hypothetical protein
MHLTNTFVYVDGPDVMGKTTIRKMLAVQSGEITATFERSPVSSVVYDSLYRRRQSMNMRDLTEMMVCAQKTNHVFFNVIPLGGAKGLRKLINSRPESKTEIEHEYEIGLYEKTIIELELFEMAFSLFNTAVEDALALNKYRHRNVFICDVSNVYTETREPGQGAVTHMINVLNNIKKGGCE